MKKLLLSAVLAALVAVPPAHASNKEENLGFGGGVVVGALAGGPIGALVGAALGAHYGNSVHTAKKLPGANRALLATEAALADKTDGLEALRGQFDETQRALAALNEEFAMLLRERAGVNELAFDVHYKTDASQPDEVARARLVQLGELLNEIPDLYLRLDGYADRRGSDDHNERLTMARAGNVKQLLVGNGVDPQRIEVYAHGERVANAAQNDRDGQALERRVRVQIKLSAESLARIEAAQAEGAFASRQ